MLKVCSKCHILKSLTQFCIRRKAPDGRDGWCRVCKKHATEKWRDTHPKHIAAYRKKWRRAHRPLVLAEKARYRKRHPKKARQQVRNAHKQHSKLYRIHRYFAGIEKRYGVTKDQIQTQAKKQKHRCAVCHQKQKCGKRRRLYVDHDHKTGKFRGLTCFNCNSMLGFAKDNIKTLQAAIIYLRSSQ